MRFTDHRSENTRVPRPGAAAARPGVRRPVMASDRDESRIDISTVLRQQRERLGLSITDISRQLKIREPYLQAIEDGAFDQLPGQTYVTGFVRSYADFLGLNGDRAATLIRPETITLGKPHRLVVPSAPPEGRIPGGAVILVALVLTASAYGGWYYLNSSGQNFADMVPEIPQSMQSLISGSPDPATRPGPDSTTPARQQAEQFQAGQVQSEQGGSAPTVPAGSGLASSAPVEPAIRDGQDDIDSGIAGARQAEIPVTTVEVITTQAVPQMAANVPAIEAAVPAPVAENVTPDVTAEDSPTGGQAAANTTPESAPLQPPGATAEIVAPAPAALPLTTDTRTPADASAASTGTTLAETGATVQDAAQVIAAAQPETVAPISPPPLPRSIRQVIQSAIRTAPASDDNATSAEPAASVPGTEVSAGTQSASGPQQADQAEATVNPPPASGPRPLLTSTLTFADDTGGSAPAAAETVPPAPAPAPAISPQQVENRFEYPPRVVIRANEDSWVRIRDAESSTLMARIMQAGETYEVPQQPGLRMTTGNAGALTIIIDGIPGKRLGDPGEVIRNIELDPDILIARQN